MVTHVEIYPFDGKFTLFKGSFTTETMEAVFPNQRENIVGVFKLIVSKITGAFGIVFINLGPEYDNAFRKRILEEAKPFEFQEVKIINEYAMKFLNAFSQSTFSLKSSIIWIFHDICQGEEYCDIWEMESGNAKLVKSFKCFWYSLCQEKIKKIKEQSGLESEPTAIFYPATKSTDFNGINKILPNCQAFPYSIKNENGAIINCIIKKNINILPTLDHNLTIKFDSVEKLFIPKMKILPFKTAILSLGYSSLEILISADKTEHKRDPNNCIPKENKSFVFEIDENGIYSYKFEDIILLTIWGTELDIFDKNHLEGAAVSANTSLNVKFNKKGYTTCSCPQGTKAIQNDNDFYYDSSNYRFLQSLIEKLPETHGRSPHEKVIIYNYLNETLQNMSNSRNNHLLNAMLYAPAASHQTNRYESCKFPPRFGNNACYDQGLTNHDLSFHSDLIRNANMEFISNYPEPTNKNSQQQKFRNRIAESLLLEATKNYEKKEIIFLLPFLPKTTEADNYEYAKALKDNGVPHVYCINMLKAIANSIYKKHGKPDIQHYIFSTFRSPYFILSYFQVKNSKATIKETSCTLTHEMFVNCTKQLKPVHIFINWFNNLPLPKRCKLHLTTSNFNLPRDIFRGHETDVEIEENFYKLIFDGFEL